jgi:predicted nicotinamide N-methyase
VSVNYNLTVLTNRLQQVINAIDDGASNGFMNLTDSGGGTLATFQLSRPSGVASLGVLTFSSLPLVAPAAGASGTASLANFTDSNGVVVISGLTVNKQGVADILMTPTNVITAGQTIAVTAATITGN